MMNKLTAAILAVGMAFFAGGASAKNEISRTIPVTEGFYERELKHNGAFYVMRYTVMVDTGEIELCGAGVVLDSQFRSIVRRYLSNMNFLIGEQILIKDFRYFAKAKSQKTLVGSMANCVSTGVKYNPDTVYDYGFGLEGRGRYRI